MGDNLEVFDFNRYLSEFHELEKLPMHRYQSWGLCYDSFKTEMTKENPDSRMLAKELTIYLASWGMMRGSSKLLTRYNYEVHIELINKIIAGNFLLLYDAPNTANIGSYIYKTVSLYDVVYNYFNDKTEVSPTETLITKIILGIFGASPAYDDYARKAMRKYNNFTGNFSKDSLSKLWNYYFDNVKDIDSYFVEKFPPMKLMDQALVSAGGIH